MHFNYPSRFRFILLLLVILGLLVGILIWSGSHKNSDTFLRDIKSFRLLSEFSERGARFIGNSPDNYSQLLESHFPKKDKLDVVSLSGNVASLTISNSNLYGARHGLLSNATKKGLAWERPGLFTFYHDGELVFQSRVGVRIHGGEYSRRVDSDSLGFRLYFRPGFGSDNISAAKVWPEVPGSISSMVMKISTNNLRNAMNMEISRRAGAMAPHVAPAQFFMNGQAWHQDTVLLMEHISRDFLDKHYGHSDFVFHRYKNDDTKYSPGPYLDLLTQLKDRQSRLTFSELAQEVDVNTLFAQYATNMLAEIYDSFQGGILLDKRTVNAKWTFVSWDMEGGFRSSWGCQMTVDQCPENMKGYFKHLGNKWGLLRESIWQRFRSDDEFRRAFTHYLAQLFRHQITDKWITDLTKHYRKIAQSNGLDYEGNHKYGLASFSASEQFLIQQKQEILALIKSEWKIDIEAIPNDELIAEPYLSKPNVE
ncbi:hypothetical protein A9Q78_10695 [Methylophaga sp. 41_12_T18]|nr:hypothetical protein A9Q78_10695 [Methylophaga sp. 41_12_T18]